MTLFNSRQKQPLFWMIMLLVLLAVPGHNAHAETGTLNNSFAMIQDPRAQAIIKTYLDILTDNPKLQQQVMGCAVEQIKQSPEIQEILGADPAKFQQSTKQQKIDMKKTLLTVKQVFQPCLQILNNNIEIN